MSDVIRLVQNDTLPTLNIALNDQPTGQPVDLTTATQVKMDFRAIGATTLTDTLYGVLLPGRVNADGSITMTGFTAAGSGGRFSINWNSSTLANPGPYEGMISVMFPGALVQSVYDTLRFNIRPEF